MSSRPGERRLKRMAHDAADAMRHGIREEKAAEKPGYEIQPGHINRTYFEKFDELPRWLRSTWKDVLDDGIVPCPNGCRRAFSNMSHATITAFLYRARYARDRCCTSRLCPYVEAGTVSGKDNRRCFQVIRMLSQALPPPLHRADRPDNRGLCG